VITVGIDLAAEPKKTGACEIEWADGVATVRRLETGLEDRDLLELIHGADKVGIDAPFGWPDEFVEAVTAHRDFNAWPGRDVDDQAEFRRRLAFRATDLAVSAVRRPLSPSTDRIGVTTMRCARLLDLAGKRDRSGTGKLVEVYPAAALVRWLFPTDPYKAARGLENLGRLTSEVRERLPSLRFASEESEQRFERNDDAFDAVIATLVARAAAIGLTDGPPEDQREIAKREGWIHLPRAGSLERLNTYPGT
jgi:predicted nuclease with RNAse H fold